MQKISSYIEVIKKRKVTFIIFIVCFFVGVILGAVLPYKNEKTLFCESTVNLMITSLSNDKGRYGIVLNRLFVDLFCLAIFVITALNFYLTIINLFLIFYKGYVLGAVMVAMIGNFGLTGVITFILIILIQSLISNFALISFSVISNYYQERNGCGKRKNGFSLLIIPAVITFLLILFGILLQFMFLALFIRPFNYRF